MNLHEAESVAFQCEAKNLHISTLVIKLNPRKAVAKEKKSNRKVVKEGYVQERK